MIVRLRYQRPPKKAPSRPVTPLLPRQPEVVTPQEMATGLASLLAPIAALVFALALWRLGQDLGITKTFFITEGTFSHWQVWLALAITIGGACLWLNRVGEDGGSSNSPTAG